jgi:hypothetical protein
VEKRSFTDAKEVAMDVFVIIVLAGLGVFISVFAGRAWSGARFSRALRTQVVRIERRPPEPTRR